MTETPEIRSLGDGKYTFLVGRHMYTLTTPLEEERFKRIVWGVKSLVESFPPTLSHDERLFLSLMAMYNQLDDVKNSLELMAESIKKQEDE